MNKKLWLRISVIVLVVAFLIGLLLYKSKNPDFALITAIIFGIIIIGVGGITFFFFEIIHFVKGKTEKKDEEKIPEPIDMEKMKRIVEDVIKSDVYEDHVRRFNSLKTRDIGKNKIYIFYLETLYDPRQCVVLLNANYPKISPNVLFNPTNPEILRAANSLSFNPREEPDVEITETESPITGAKSKTVKKTYQKKSEEKKKEET